MIIQCPNCGFSGRIPEYAIAVPHHARCLKCRHRFELSGRLARIPVEAMSVATRETDALPSDQGFGDPSSSCYELKAITDEFGPAPEPKNMGDLWGEQEDEDFEGAKGRGVPQFS